MRNKTTHRKAEEVELGEPPEEFVCPIMATLMEFPVKLPGNFVVDRSSIEQCLLNKAVNPFTNQPMTLDDVVPHDDLRVRIERWKKGEGSE